MKRPLAVVAALALTAIAGLAPAVSASADDTPSPTPSATPTASATPPRTYPGVPDPPLAPSPRVPKTFARWVNGTLTVAFSLGGPFYQGTSDTDTVLKVDGEVVESLAERNRSSDVVRIPRSAAAGPALVEVTAWDQIESGYSYSYPTTFYSASIHRTVVKAKKGQASAVTLLGELRVAKEAHASTYRSAKFTYGIDADGDGENTRAEVLKSESKKHVTESNRHVVETGRWVSAYDGKTYATASRLAIDHLVPLKEAWTSGAATWSARKREAYANDIGYSPSLVAVSQHASRAKGAEEPNGYLPTRSSYRCTYVRDYIAVKYRWGLSIDPDEKAALMTDLAEYCTSPFVAKPGKPNLTALVGKPKPVRPGSGGGSTSGLDPQYPTCTELLKHPNHAPYRRGVDPEYSWYQDRDHDGLVCE